jgi:hypothetical protein
MSETMQTTNPIIPPNEPEQPSTGWSTPIPTRKHNLGDYVADIESGHGYNKSQLVKRVGGDYVLKPPNSLYPALALLPTLTVIPEFSGAASMIVGFTPLLGAAVLSAWAQFGAVYYISIMNEQFEDLANDPTDQAPYEVCSPPGTAYALRLICLIVFLCTCLADVKSSVEFLDYIAHVPDLTEEHRLLLEQNNFAVMCVKRKVTAGVLDRAAPVESMRTGEDRNGAGDECVVEGYGAGGFSKKGRCWALFWALTQLAIEALVIFVGSEFVLYSTSNEQLILNAVALTFVIQIDEAIYRFVVTGLMKGWMDGLIGIGLIAECSDPRHNMDTKRIISQIFGQYIQGLVLLVTALVCWASACN